MNPIDQDYSGARRDLGQERYGVPYEELCAEFLAAAARAAKSAALYSLSHPVVMESLGRAYAALAEVLEASGGGELSVAFANDAWMFNGRAVPAAGGDPHGLDGMLKAHGVRGIIFEPGVRPSEVAALCEFLGASPRGQTAGTFMAFMSARGITHIRSEEVRYVKESGYAGSMGAPQAAAAQTPAVKPRPAVLNPAPKVSPRPAAQFPDIAPAPAVRPARAPLPAAPPPQVPLPAGGAGAPVGRGGTGRGAGEGPGAGRGGGQGAGQGQGQGAGQGQGQGGGQGNGPGAEQGGGRGEGQGNGQGGGGAAGTSLGTLLTTLVESAVKDPRERVKMYEDTLKMLREGMDRQIDQATKALAAEKEEILNTRNRTESVLSQVAEGKVIVDKDGKILMMNPAAEQISGRKLSEVVGKHISEHLNPAEHMLTISKDMDLSAGNPITGEVSVAGDEMVSGALRRSMALLEDDQGRVVGAYATLPDMTKFKEAQRLQDEFLSRVTHDLQSPLSSISAALEILTESAAAKLSADESNFLTISLRNSRRLTEMIRGILDFSKLKAGKMSVHPEPVPLSPILNEAVDSLLPWAKTKGVTLTLRCCRPDINVLADHGRIVQVVTNLVSNAIKSTPRGGEVIVAAARALTPEHSALVGVRDTGPGISKENMAKIFERFVQLEDNGPREGVGLGLSIVKEFVAQHNGRVWAESPEGQGATFYFTLPMAS
ncbi:MAG: ATP-binding protein [Elusimicrobiales bacterium]